MDGDYNECGGEGKQSVSFNNKNQHCKKHPHFLSYLGRGEEEEEEEKVGDT